MNIVLIAAIGRNREIGKGPELIWRIPGDLKRFKELTVGHPVVMGRKTFASIGRPLPKRVNIIVTRDASYRAEGAVVAHSVEQALGLAKSFDTEKVFVIGGGEIYKTAIPFADTLELTLIEAEDKNADVFFPEYENDFEKTAEENSQQEDGIEYRWATYGRK